MTVFDAIGDVLDRVAAVAPITPKARAVADLRRLLRLSEGRDEPPKAAAGFSASRARTRVRERTIPGWRRLGSIQAAGGLEGRATWYFPAGTFAFGLGLSIEGTLFRAMGPLESVTGVIAPSRGFPIRGASGPRTASALHRRGRGAALMSLQTPIYGSQSIFLPYAGAGIGLGWVLGSGLCLSLDLSYRLFLDGSDLISGFDPQFAIDIPLGKRSNET